MAEPEIRYTTTADGVSIAYYTMGEGLPLVVTSTVLWSHFRLQPFREYHRSRSGQGLGRGLQVVRYDARGTGLSDRHPLDFSMDARLLDLEAVVERLKLTRFAIFGLGHGTLAAIVYAASHPERISHLILHNGLVRARDSREAFSGWDSLRETADEQWERYTLTLANAQLDFNDSEAARKRAAFYRESMSPESMRAFYTADLIDVTPVLPRLAVPTLVMYRARAGSPSESDWSRELASKIPDARLVTLAPQVDMFWTDEQTRIIEDFLGLSQEAPAPSPSVVSPAASSGMAVVLFTDIVDSTALTERLGDTVFRTASRALDEGMRAAMRESGGTPVDGKVLGDGVMGVFTSASQAIAAARRCIALSAESELQLHVGLHAGDVIHEKGNVYGGAVNIASRVCGLSAPGEVLVSDIVRGLARTSAGVEFEDRGEQALKGIDDAVRVYEVRWRKDDA
jgi:class 3 adenylate cyclase